MKKKIRRIPPPVNLYLLARNVLERVIPRVEGRSLFAKKEEIETELKTALVNEKFCMLLYPFNRYQRQVFLHITPNIKVIVRMVRVGDTFRVVQPKAPDSFQHSVWLD